MATQVTSIGEFHSLPFGTKFRVEWPENELNGQVIESVHAKDGHQSSMYIEVARSGELLILDADAFREGCALTVLN